MGSTCRICQNIMMTMTTLMAANTPPLVPNQHNEQSQGFQTLPRVTCLEIWHLQHPLLVLQSPDCSTQNPYQDFPFLPNWHCCQIPCWQWWQPPAPAPFILTHIGWSKLHWATPPPTPCYWWFLQLPVRTCAINAAFEDMKWCWPSTINSIYGPCNTTCQDSCLLSSSPPPATLSIANNVNTHWNRCHNWQNEVMLAIKFWLYWSPPLWHNLSQLVLPLPPSSTCILLHWQSIGLPVHTCWHPCPNWTNESLLAIAPMLDQEPCCITLCHSTSPTPTATLISINSQHDFGKQDGCTTHCQLPCHEPIIQHFEFICEFFWHFRGRHHWPIPSCCSPDTWQFSYSISLTDWSPQWHCLLQALQWTMLIAFLARPF